MLIIYYIKFVKKKFLHKRSLSIFSLHRSINKIWHYSKLQCVLNTYWWGARVASDLDPWRLNNNADAGASELSVRIRASPELSERGHRPSAHRGNKQYCLARLLVSGADRIYLLIARRPHTRATAQQTDFAGWETSAQTAASSIFQQISWFHISADLINQSILVMKTHMCFIFHYWSIKKL